MSKEHKMKENKMNEDYVAGFMAKAAELGVDPEALIKLSDDDLDLAKLLGGTGATLGGIAGGGAGFGLSELARAGDSPESRYGRMFATGKPALHRGESKPPIKGVKTNPPGMPRKQKPRNLKHALLMSLLGAGLGAVGVGAPAAGIGGLIDEARS